MVNKIVTMLPIANINKNERNVSMLWKDKRTCPIDAQHKSCSCAESFCGHCGQKSANEKSKLNETLEFMKRYVVEHFHDEKSQRVSIIRYEVQTDT